jgi:hypothetical protein
VAGSSAAVQQTAAQITQLQHALGAALVKPPAVFAELVDGCLTHELDILSGYALLQVLEHIIAS